MKAKLAGIMFVFIVIILGTTMYFYNANNKEELEDNKAKQIVLTNEVEQLISLGKYEEALTKTKDLKELIKEYEIKEKEEIHLVIICIIAISTIVLVFGYVYIAILRPFKRLESFANEVAKGNLELPLEYDRANYFGKFTWAFDRMRNEILRARACEKEAIENNKTIIATISHDIKTPIASIRAYTEGLEANMDTNMEKRQKYCQVIMDKCDEVARLTGDLFVHSISDMDKIHIVMSEFEVCSFIERAISDISLENEKIKYTKPQFEARVNCDKNRLLQIVENIINNSAKYAKTDMDISIEKEDSYVRIVFRDYGVGIADEDMPFIFDKFYRGKNVADEQGSGLGLYIVKYLMNKMQGEVLVENVKPGLKVTIVLRTS